MAFFAPEMCDRNILSYSGKTADIWALGVTIYAIIFNKVPFTNESYEVLDDIFEQEIEFGKRNLSQGLKELILGMLDKKAEKRWTLEQIKDSLWLKEGYEEKIEMSDLSKPLLSRGTTLSAVMMAKKSAKKMLAFQKNTSSKSMFIRKSAKIAPE